MDERRRILAALLGMVTLSASGCAAEVDSAPPDASTVAPTIRASLEVPSPTAPPSAAGASLDPTLVDGLFPVGDGRSLYLHCVGMGSPTLILEPGDGGDSQMMSPIADAFGATHRVCVYDRANKGRSDPAPSQRPVRYIADDLGAVLEAAGEHGPFLPVGTSLGGTAAYLFAVLHADEVAGFVSINPPEDPTEWLPAVKPIISASDYADEIAFGTGAQGNERYDITGWLAVGDPPDAMPYRIVDSGRGQCEGDPLCLSVYDVIIDQTKAMADRGAGGTWVQIPGLHQLQQSNPKEVVGVINDVLAAAGS